MGKILKEISKSYVPDEIINGKNMALHPYKSSVNDKNFTCILFNIIRKLQHEWF
tara:strand:- start:446 stop:607 length:162 start_codon:yes stop_codon:yes gene_type:complete